MKPFFPSKNVDIMHGSINQSFFLVYIELETSFKKKSTADPLFRLIYSQYWVLSTPRPYLYNNREPTNGIYDISKVKIILKIPLWGKSANQ
jgi:hypothetical protein